MRAGWANVLVMAGLTGALPGPAAATPPAGSGLSTNCVQAPVGIENWWPGDGSTADIQGSQSGLIDGRAEFAPGKVGQTLQFDGTNGVVKAEAAFRGTDGWAMVAWTLWRGPIQSPKTKGQAIFYHGETGKDGYGLFIIGPGWCQDFPDLCSHEGELTVLYGGVRWSFTDVVLPQEEWTHVALVRSGGFLKLYLNGTLYWYRQSIEPIAPSSSFRISMEPPLTFNGRIDETALFSAPLDMDSLAPIVQAGAAGICKGPNFIGVGHARTGPVTFEVLGQRNKDVVIWISQDLIVWEPVLQLTNPSGLLGFAAPPSPGVSQRFYRLSPLSTRRANP